MFPRVLILLTTNEVPKLPGTSTENVRSPSRSLEAILGLVDLPDTHVEVYGAHQMALMSSWNCSNVVGAKLTGTFIPLVTYTLWKAE